MESSPVIAGFLDNFYLLLLFKDMKIEVSNLTYLKELKMKV